MKKNVRGIILWLLAFQLVCFVLPGSKTAFAESNISETYKYAWSENGGWLNWRTTHGQATIEATYVTGYVWAENVGWIKLGSDSGGPYANNAADNWGVNHDSGTGALSGYAWSENAGWINFNPTNGGVTIDTGTGRFHGYAWGENIGWIHFQNSVPAYYVAKIMPIPEMDITGNGHAIADGETTPNTGDHTDFGSVDVNGGAQARTFTIYNNGTADLTLSDNPRVSISGEVTEFSLTSDATATVAAGSNTTFTITFNPTAIGTKTATVTIANSDSNENPYTFTIEGTGIIPGKVTNNNDDGPGSLRQTIADASAGDTITFDSDYTITLDTPLAIDKNITITGNGPANTIIQADANPGTADHRVMEITAGDVTMEGLTIKHGVATSGEDGGGILVRGTTPSLALSNVVIENNSANNGGGIYNNGIIISLSNSTISKNSANNNGGGIYNNSTIADLSNNTISKNSANNNGGGIYNNGTIAALSNSTISKNSANNNGGGIYTASQISLVNTIIINNRALLGPDIYGNANAYYSWFNQTSGTIIEQTTAPNVKTAYTEGDLADLADNDGPTQTMAIHLGTPAYRTGAFIYYNETDGYYLYDTDGMAHGVADWLTAPSDPNESDKITTDQRGETRGYPPCMGAYEYPPPFPTVTTQAVTGIGNTTATGNGTITDLGTPNPTSHGVCWSTSANPTVSDYHTDKGTASETGAFTSSITGLSSGTPYHVRAYATNSAGTAYGADVIFTTSSPHNPDPTPDPEPDPTPDPEPDPTPDPEPDPTPDPEPSNPLEDVVDEVGQAIGEAGESGSDDTGGSAVTSQEVHAALEKVEEALALAEELVDDGTLTPGEALLALTVVDDTLRLLEKAADDGVTVDGQNVTDLLDHVLNIITEALAANPNQEDLSSIVENSDAILEPLSDIMKSVDLDVGLAIAQQAEALVLAALTAGLEQSSIDIEVLGGFIDTIGDLITALTLDTTITGNISVMATAADVIAAAVETLSASDIDISELMAGLQSETASIMVAIYENIMLNPIPYSDAEGIDGQKSLFEDDGASENPSKTHVTPEKIQSLLQKISQLIAPFIRQYIPLNETLVSSVETVLDGAFTAIVDQLAGLWGMDTDSMSLCENTTALTSSLMENPLLLEQILENSTISICCETDRSELMDTLLDLAESFSSEEADVIEAALPEILDHDRAILEIKGSSATDILTGALTSSLPDLTVTVTAVSPAVVTLGISLDGVQFYGYPMQISDIYFISSQIPDGVYCLSDGRLFFVSGTMGITATPVFDDIFDVILAMDRAALPLTMEKDGRWHVKMNATGEDTTTFLSAMVGYGVMPVDETKEKSDQTKLSDAISFEIIGDDPATSEYLIQITINGTSRQVVSPALYCLSALTSYLEKLHINFSIDRTSGLIILDSFFFKPDFNARTLNGTDLLYWSSNSTDNVAWRVEDFNGDGVSDLEFITLMGKQVLYTVLQK